MPGLELFSSNSNTPAAAPASTIVELPVNTVPAHDASANTSDSEPQTPDGASIPRSLLPSNPNAYYNPRLDPKNFLEGPLSWNPATRLRQMLARPGIVVRT